MLYRLMFSQIYAGVWDIDYFFGHSFGKKQMMILLLAADYPFTIWIETDSNQNSWISQIS